MWNSHTVLSMKCIQQRNAINNGNTNGGNSAKTKSIEQLSVTPLDSRMDTPLHNKSQNNIHWISFAIIHIYRRNVQTVITCQFYNYWKITYTYEHFSILLLHQQQLLVAKVVVQNNYVLSVWSAHSCTPLPTPHPQSEVLKTIQTLR